MPTPNDETPKWFGPHGWSTWPLCWLATSIIALAGSIYAWRFLDLQKQKEPLTSLTNWDGQPFRSIITVGYEYSPLKQTRVAFFPAYPLAGKLLTFFGLDPSLALLIVSYGSLLAAFGLLAMYLRPGVRERMVLVPDRPDRVASASFNDFPMTRRMVVFALLAMGVWPTSFFFRVAYSESLFLCLSLLTMVVLARGRPLWNAAVIAGAATAVRPVGLALLLPMAWEAWRISPTPRQAIARMAVVLPIGCWGILAFMGYQWSKFGDPFAFYVTETVGWRMRPAATPPGDKLWSLVSWEPIWGAFISGAWAKWPEPQATPIQLFSLQLANPIYWIAAVGLTAVGTVKRWLTPHEMLFSAAALGLPYLARSYEMCMTGQGRLTASVFPIYIVLGHLLARLPLVVSLALLALLAFMMAAYAALFTAGYWMT